MTRTAMYRYYDADGVLLYLGITDDTYQRWRSHEIKARWWALVASSTVEWYPSREAAADAEKLAIAEEKPLRNIKDVPGYNPRGQREYRPATPFWRYVLEVVRYPTGVKVARKMDGAVPPCDVNHWPEATPPAEVIVAFARAYNRSPIEALHRAGILSHAESRPMDASIAMFTDAELAAELARRLAEPSGRAA